MFLFLLLFSAVASALIPDLTKHLKMIVVFGKPTTEGLKSKDDWEDCLDICWETWDCVVSFYDLLHI